MIIFKVETLAEFKGFHVIVERVSGLERTTIYSHVVHQDGHRSFHDTVWALGQVCSGLRPLYDIPEKPDPT